MRPHRSTRWLELSLDETYGLTRQNLWPPTRLTAHRRWVEVDRAEANRRARDGLVEHPRLALRGDARTCGARAYVRKIT